MASSWREPFRYLAIVLLLSVLHLAQATDAVLAQEDLGPAAPTVVDANGDGLVLEWTAPDVAFDSVVAADSRTYVRLEAPGWDFNNRPGWPEVPLATALAVAPPDADVTLHIESSSQVYVPLPHAVQPAPTPARIASSADGCLTEAPATLVGDPQAYAPQTPVIPWQAVSIDEIGWLHGHRLLRILFRPFQYAPAGPALRVTRSIRFRVVFDGHARLANAEGSSGPFALLLQNTVLNGENVQAFVRQPSPQASSHSLAHLDQRGAPPDTDYLIITSADLITAVAPLATRREAQGLKVYTETVDAIYAAYSGGSVSAMAIRDYISTTYHSVTPPTLDTVLLVGDGTDDGSGPQVVPPFMVTIDPACADPQVAASDNRYAAVDGSDNLPDVLIGRLPVNSIAEAQTVVSKILDYEQSSPQWPWNERVLFFAGNELHAGEAFHTDADAVHATLPVTFSGQRAYFCTQYCPQPYHITEITVAHDAVIDHLAGGALLASYVGHSSQHQWDVDPETYRPLLHLDDIVDIENGLALPVILGLTCFTSNFADPAGPTLDESFVRHEHGGAIATFGSTSLGCARGHHVLHKGFHDALLTGGVSQLGAAVAATQLDLIGWALFDSYQDLLDSFVLFGDPATEIDLTIAPWPHQTYLPLLMRRHVSLVEHFHLPLVLRAR